MRELVATALFEQLNEVEVDFFELVLAVEPEQLRELERANFSQS